MPTLPLTFACGLYDRVMPLYTGEVKPEGIDLRFVVENAPRHLFDQMQGEGAFDASEMSLSEFICQSAHPDWPYVALPVFPSRVFRHGYIVVNGKAGLSSPKELEGKRIGVPNYFMTAAIYIRGLLQHEYGVDLSTITWVQGELDRVGGHGKPPNLPLLGPVKIETNQSEKSLSQLLEAGDISATIGANVPAALGVNPDLVRLFPNYRDLEMDHYRRTGIFPIMHVVAIKRSLVEAHPFVAQSLYTAFLAAKNKAMQSLRLKAASFSMLPWARHEAEEMHQLFGGDFWPYGLEANRRTLEALVAYVVEQHLLAAKIPVEQLFLPVE